MACPCPLIDGMPYDPWEFMVSGWLNWEGDRIYVANDFIPSNIYAYTFPGLVYDKEVAGLNADNISGVAAGRSGAVYAWEDGSFESAGLWRWQMRRANTSDDTDDLLIASGLLPHNRVDMIYDSAQAVLYAHWQRTAADLTDVLWEIDETSGAHTEIWTLAGTTTAVNDVRSNRPSYTLDGLLWLSASTPTHVGVLSIDPNTSAEVFYPVSTTHPAITATASDGDSIYVSLVGGSNYKISGGVVTTVGCNYQGSQPYYDVIDAGGNAYYQWFGADIGIWHWNCGRKWFLGVSGWGP